MSSRFKVEVFFVLITLVWCIAGAVSLFHGKGLEFLAGWVMGAVSTSLLECMPGVRKRVATWEHSPWYFTFIVHFTLPLICLFTLRQIPGNYRDWKATPKPRYKNYGYPRGDK